MTTKILILNVGWPNKGNRALVDSTIEAITKFIPDAEFTFMGYQEINRDGFCVKKKICCGLGNPDSTLISIGCFLKCLYINILKKLNMKASISKNSRLFEYYDSDIVINSGGDQLSGEYGFGTLGNLLNITYGILLDKPVVLYGESLGYFKNRSLNFIATVVFNRTKLILVREEISKKYLDDNHITVPKVYVTADPAFLLNAAPQSRIIEIEYEEGIKKDKRPLIGINPSGLIDRFRGKNPKEQFNSLLAKVIDDVSINLKANIILIPHVYTPNSDDRICIKSIFDKVKDKSKVITIQNEYTPQELKGIIGQCDLFIGARMHATIASTSMFVPTVGIAYSHKMHGIIGKMLGQEKYILNIETLEYESLITAINNAWENREEIKKELEMKIPDVKSKAMLNGKLVKELLFSVETT